MTNISPPTNGRPISPCVKICQMETSSSVCRGCGRTLDEIAGWGMMTEAEKAPVWDRLEAGGFVSKR